MKTPMNSDPRSADNVFRTAFTASARLCCVSWWKTTAITVCSSAVVPSAPLACGTAAPASRPVAAPSRGTDSSDSSVQRRPSSETSKSSMVRSRTCAPERSRTVTSRSTAWVEVQNRGSAAGGCWPPAPMTALSRTREISHQRISSTADDYRRIVRPPNLQRSLTSEHIGADGTSGDCSRQGSSSSAPFASTTAHAGPRLARFQPRTS